MIPRIYIFILYLTLFGCFSLTQSCVSPHKTVKVRGFMYATGTDAKPVMLDEGEMICIYVDSACVDTVAKNGGFQFSVKKKNSKQIVSYRVIENGKPKPYFQSITINPRRYQILQFNKQDHDIFNRIDELNVKDKLLILEDIKSNIISLANFQKIIQSPDSIEKKIDYLKGVRQNEFYDASRGSDILDVIDDVAEYTAFAKEIMLNIKVDNLTYNNKKLRDEKMALDSTVSCLKEKINALNYDIDTLGFEKKKLTNEKVGLYNEILLVKDENKNLNKDKKNLQISIEELEKKKKELESHNKDFLKKKKSLESEIQKKENALSKLEASYSEQLNLFRISLGLLILITILLASVWYLYKTNKRLVFLKDSLLQFTNHQLKNGLQPIMPKISNYLSRYKDTILDDTKLFLTDLQIKLEIITKLHRKICYSDKVRNENCIKIGPYLTELVEYIKNIYQERKQQIQIQSQFSDNLELDIKRTRLICIVITELVTNSYRHAFKYKNDGEIIVFMKELTKSKGQRYILGVKDNGVGMNKDLFIKKTTFTPGEHIHGLATLSDLVAYQLGGDINLKSQKIGTCIIVDFPKK